MRSVFRCLLSSLLFLVTTYSFGTHLRCGQIRVEQLDAASKKVKITIIIFTNTKNTTVQFGGDQDVLDFGDGKTVLVPEISSEQREGLPPYVEVAEYSIVHEYPAFGFYTVSYREPNRNEGIVNFAASVSTPVYLESAFALLPNKVYKSPVPMLDPIFTGYLNAPFSASIAAVDDNQYQLLYVPVVPFSGRQTTVIDYVMPESYRLNRKTGLITWDSKFNGNDIAGEYLFAARIEQYDTVNGKFRRVGYMYRDFQIILEDRSGLTGGRIDDNLADEHNDIVALDDTESRVLKLLAIKTTGYSAYFTLKTDMPEEFYSFETYDSTHEDQSILVGKLQVTNDPSIARIAPFVFSIRTTFTNNVGWIYLADQSYAIETREFVPAEGPVLSIDEEVEQITATPNPFTKKVRINGQRRAAATLNIYNTMGQLTTVAHSQSNEFDLSHLPAGMYIAKVLDTAGRIVGICRILKE
jgi:hypothetical protein